MAPVLAWPDVMNMNNAINLQNLYRDLLIYGVFILIGAAIVYANWRRVKFFVDPSSDIPFGSSGVVLKKLLGGTGFRIYWYVFGGLCFMAGFAGFIAGLRRLFFGLQP